MTGAELVDALERAKVSQSELARRLEYSRDSVRFWVHGRNGKPGRVPAKCLPAVRAALGLSASERPLRQRLRHLLRAVRLTRAEAARRGGWSLKLLNAWLEGRAEIPLEVWRTMKGWL